MSYKPTKLSGYANPNWVMQEAERLGENLGENSEFTENMGYFVSRTQSGIATAKRAVQIMTDEHIFLADEKVFSEEYGIDPRVYNQLKRNFTITNEEGLLLWVAGSLNNIHDRGEYPYLTAYLKDLDVNPERDPIDVHILISRSDFSRKLPERVETFLRKAEKNDYISVKQCRYPVRGKGAIPLATITDDANVTSLFRGKGGLIYSGRLGRNFSLAFDDEFESPEWKKIDIEINGKKPDAVSRSRPIVVKKS